MYNCKLDCLQNFTVLILQMCERCGLSYRSKKSLKSHICQGPKESDGSPLERITETTSQSLIQTKKKSSLKLRIKIPPKQKTQKEDLNKTLNLKNARVCLEKLDLGELETSREVRETSSQDGVETSQEINARKSLKVSRKLSSQCNVSSGPMAAKRIKYIEMAKDKQIEDDGKDISTIGNELQEKEKDATLVENASENKDEKSPNSVSFQNPAVSNLVKQTSEQVSKFTVPKSQMNLVKVSNVQGKQPKKYKKRSSNLTRKKCHKKANAKATVNAAAVGKMKTKFEAVRKGNGDPSKVVSGDMELSVDDSHEVDNEGKDLDLDLDGNDLDLGEECLNGSGNMNENMYEGVTIKEEIEDDDFVVSVNEDFAEGGSQKGEDEDKKERGCEEDEKQSAEAMVSKERGKNTKDAHKVINENTYQCVQDCSSVSRAIENRSSRVSTTDIVLGNSGSGKETVSEDITTENTNTGEPLNHEDIISQNELVEKNLTTEVNSTYRRDVMSQNEIDSTQEDNGESSSNHEDIMPQNPTSKSQNSTEIDFISEMENVMNDVLGQKEKKKEQRNTQNEEAERGEVSASQNGTEQTPNTQSTAQNFAIDTEEKIEEALSEEEIVKDEILQKLKAIASKWKE